MGLESNFREMAGGSPIPDAGKSLISMGTKSDRRREGESGLPVADFSLDSDELQARASYMAGIRQGGTKTSS